MRVWRLAIINSVDKVGLARRTFKGGLEAGGEEGGVSTVAVQAARPAHTQPKRA